MTNLLVLPDLGQGPNIWGPVWGHLTAPRQSPPSLSLAPAVGAVTTIDFRAALGDPWEATLEEATDHVADQARALGEAPALAVGHGMGAALLLASLPKWSVPPKRVALFAGVVPSQGASIISALPLPARYGLGLLPFPRMAQRRLQIPKRMVYQRLCNGMETMEVVHYVAAFHPLPLQWLRSPLAIPQDLSACPITYVALERDRLLAPRLQREQARRAGAQKVLSLDACHQAMLQQPEEVARIIRQEALAK